MLAAPRDKYGNVRTGLKFDEFQTNFHLHHQSFPCKDALCVGVCVTLVQLASEVTLE